MTRLAAFLLSLLLVGCATVGVDRVEQLKPGAKIVPLSLMGDKLAIRFIGTTVFQNARRDLEVPSWHIDTYVDASATRMIRQGVKFSAVPIDAATARKSAGKLGQDFWTSAAVIEGGTESVIRLAKDAGAEYVLVMGPSQLGDPFFGTNQSFSGYGVGQRSIFGSARAVNYLTMRVILLDAKDGKEVARTHGYLSSPRAAREGLGSENRSLSESDAAATKAAIESLIDAVLAKGLAELKLNQ